MPSATAPIISHPLIPPDQHRPLLRRMAVVWAVAVVIGLINMSGNSGGRLVVSMVYAFAISTSIWIFTDLLRYPFRALLRAEAPHYWPPLARALPMMLLGIPLGYVLGTAVGDAYAGHSTWDLWTLDRRRFTGIMVSSLAISLAFLFYFHQRSRSEQLERQATEAQLLLLQSQLEPHMLFNVLANLRVLIGIDPARAQTLLDHLDGYLRRTLQASRAEGNAHTLEQEFALLQDYLALMQVRMGPRLQYALDLPDTLRQHPLPALLLQPLVENAIRHGLEPQVRGGTVTVQARQQDGALCLEVQDDGVGFDAPPPQASARPPAAAGSGYGLHHIRQRLNVLYGNAARLDLRSQAGHGTQANLVLPRA